MDPLLIVITSPVGIASVAFVFVTIAPPLLPIVNPPLKVKVFTLVILWSVVPLKVTRPSPEVNVPLLVKFPPILMAGSLAPLNVVVASIVRSPLTVSVPAAMVLLKELKVDSRRLA